MKRQFYCDVIFVQIFGTLYCICVCHFISCGGLGRALVRSLISHDHDLKVLIAHNSMKVKSIVTSAHTDIRNAKV